jgi:hypothetical protein
VLQLEPKWIRANMSNDACAFSCDLEPPSRRWLTKKLLEVPALLKMAKSEGQAMWLDHAFLISYSGTSEVQSGCRV